MNQKRILSDSNPIINYNTENINILQNQDYILPNLIQSKDNNQYPPEKIIRTIKNKKKVYCMSNNFQPINKNNIISSNLNNRNLENNNSQNEKNSNIDLEENTKNKKRGLRGSKYRGVSKNGNQWQVLIMINKKKRYIGNYRNEEEAATSYDIVAIQNHGSKAKTNFYYTPEEIQRIKFMKYLYDG